MAKGSISTNWITPIEDRALNDIDESIPRLGLGLHIYQKPYG